MSSVGPNVQEPPSDVDALREALEDMVRQFGYVGDGKIGTCGLSALEGAFAALGWDDPCPAPVELICDEPGCGAASSCGAPGTPYRYTCYKHWRLRR